jgi:BMFP domain-containing protein YqiC
MSFESFRGYVQLASGLGELTRARAMEAAQGLMSMPGVSVATGKFAVQVGALAEELLAAATTNREHLTALVRGEVDAAVTRLGLVPAEKLDEARAEAARLRAEVAALRSASKRSTARTAKKTAAKKTAVKKTAAKKAAVKKAAVKKAAATNPATKPAAARRSAVTTPRTPAGT